MDGTDLVEFAWETEQVDLAKAREKAECNERAVDRAYQKDFRELKLKLEQQKKINSSAKFESIAKNKKTKLPAFSDGRDEMDAYLQQFERFAKKEWATSSSSLLIGKALEA